MLYLRSCVALFGAVMHNSGFWALVDNHVLKSDWNSCSTECGHILSIHHRRCVVLAVSSCI